MGFRFFKRIKLAPGLTLNLSKSGGSLSFGPRGAKVTVGPKGKRATVGLPGTGIFYTETFSGSRRKRARPSSEPPPAPVVAPEDRLTMGFFKRLITPSEEQALVDGCRELAQGREAKALEYLGRAVHLADGAYLAGVLSLKKGLWSEAERFLGLAEKNADQLNSYFSKYGIAATVSIAITDEISAHVGPDIRGVWLCLVEVFQKLERREEGMRCLDRLLTMEPEDAVVKLSLVEWLLLSPGLGTDGLRKVVRLTEGLGNDSSVHTALMLYKARALRRLDLKEAALETLTQALRRTAGRSEHLLRALRYERALAYEDQGNRRRARAEFEKLYAESPDYEDVAVRLKLE